MSDTSAVRFGRTEVGYVVLIEGRGCAQQSVAVREFVQACLEDRDAQVVVDLNACEYLDSTFLGCLAELHRRHQQDPPRFLVAASREATDRLLRATRLDLLLNFTDAPAPAADTCMSLPEGQRLDPREFGQHVMECHRRLSELGGSSAEAFARIADRLAEELKQPAPESGPGTTRSSEDP
jgi:anti-anti-sigma factor